VLFSLVIELVSDVFLFFGAPVLLVLEWVARLDPSSQQSSDHYCKRKSCHYSCEEVDVDD
jgi:hypothetical protein